MGVQAPFCKLRIAPTESAIWSTQPGIAPCYICHSRPAPVHLVYGVSHVYASFHTCSGHSKPRIAPLHTQIRLSVAKLKFARKASFQPHSPPVWPSPALSVPRLSFSYLKTPCRTACVCCPTCRHPPRPNVELAPANPPFAPHNTHILQAQYGEHPTPRPCPSPILVFNTDRPHFAADGCKAWGHHCAARKAFLAFPTRRTGVMGRWCSTMVGPGPRNTQSNAALNA